LVINISSVKSEALLLFCRDLIGSYKNNDDNIFSTKKSFKIFVNTHIEDLQKAINVVLQPNEYYIRNMRVYRIKTIIKCYNYINKMISNHLKKDNSFNPAMLCFALLTTWFKELGYENESKEFIFFSLYPYGEIYDEFLIKITDTDYKMLNLRMIKIAEDSMLKLHNLGV